MPSGPTRQQQVQAVLAPAVEALGFDLEDVRISPAGRRSAR